ncbi:MAG: DUF4167 domain-containing protein [Proteobacteria bacterium]|nr:DUF4167 domain-containing protein [Pseudomonadota bacterium]
MRQPQGSKRSRNNNNRSGNARHGGGRQTSFDSNGPSVRIRGNAHQIHEKYLTLSRDAGSAGDRVAAENFSQHAEHYYRLIAADIEQREERERRANAQQGGSGRQQSNNGQGNASEGRNDAANDEPIVEMKTGPATSDNKQKSDGKDRSDEDASQEATVETITVDQSPTPEDQERAARE